VVQQQEPLRPVFDVVRTIDACGCTDTMDQHRQRHSVWDLQGVAIGWVMLDFKACRQGVVEASGVPGLVWIWFAPWRWLSLT
jgi:hypothetical protein